jgi:hypothetical protein
MAKFCDVDVALFVHIRKTGRRSVDLESYLVLMNLLPHWAGLSSCI